MLATIGLSGGAAVEVSAIARVSLDRAY